jgi:hypothetical protein
MTEISGAVTQPEARDRQAHGEKRFPWARSSVQLEFPDGFRQGLA